MTRHRLVLLCALALVLAIPSGGAASQTSMPAAKTFVSLVPACACDRHTELDLFSAANGRIIHKVTTIRLVPSGETSARLAQATQGGRLFLTVTKGAHCDEPSHRIYMECPRWVSGSCRNSVETLSPGQSRFTTAFTVAGTRQISDVVPDPAGNEVALTMSTCVSLRGTTGLFIRGLRSGRTRPIVTSGNRCDGYGPTAWNQAGTELAFLLNRADGKPIPMAGGIGCPSGRDYLALVSIGPSTHRKLKLLRPDRGCVFRAVAFDVDGLVAAEGCNRDSPPNEGGGFLGQGVLVQYSPHRQVLRRILLKPGVEDAQIASEPDGNKLLITQDQPANSGYRPRDWVWSYDGQHLGLVAHYRSEDADQILAIPW